jgi:hypothetical protein
MEAAGIEPAQSAAYADVNKIPPRSRIGWP